MFNIEYYNRYNQRIVVSGSGGISLNGAVSTVLDSDLSPSLVLVSNASGKISASATPSSKLSNLDDTSAPIGAALAAKEPILTKGNLSEVTSSVLTVSGGTQAVIGSGVTIQVKQATTGQSGYLSSGDWNTFNSKLSNSLADGRIIVGDGGGVAQPRLPSGDVTMSNLAVFTISASAITNSKVAAAAAIAVSKLAAMTATKVAITDASGFLSTSTITPTELAFLSGMSGDPIQTQLNNRLQTTITSLATGDILYYNGTAWVNLARGSTGQVLTATAGSIQWQAGTSNGIPTGGATNEYLRKTSASDYAVAWGSIVIAHVSDITASAAQINVLQTGYYDATSSVQTQINNKLNKALTYKSMFVGDALNIAVALATSGTDGHLLTSVGGSPTWSAPASWLLASGATLTGNNQVNMGSNNLNIYGTGNVGFFDSSTDYDGASSVIRIKSRVTAPSGTILADNFYLYGQDITAGNAAPHFMTESGDVIKLFKGAALTAELTSITHTAPGTPDYAIQDLTNITPYGFVTKDEGNTVLSVIARLQTRVTELEARFQALGLLA